LDCEKVRGTKEKFDEFFKMASFVISNRHFPRLLLEKDVADYELFESILEIFEKKIGKSFQFLIVTIAERGCILFYKDIYTKEKTIGFSNLNGLLTHLDSVENDTLEFQISSEKNTNNVVQAIWAKQINLKKRRNCRYNWSWGCIYWSNLLCHFNGKNVS